MLTHKMVPLPKQEERRYYYKTPSLFQGHYSVPPRRSGNQIIISAMGLEGTFLSGKAKAFPNFLCDIEMSMESLNSNSGKRIAPNLF